LSKFYTELDAKLKEFIAEQKIFFVGIAGTVGCVNVSPEGMDVQSFVISRMNMSVLGVTYYFLLMILNA
jgi:hypothetical protein